MKITSVIPSTISCSAATRSRTDRVWPTLLMLSMSPGNQTSSGKDQKWLLIHSHLCSEITCCTMEKAKVCENTYAYTWLIHTDIHIFKKPVMTSQNTHWGMTSNSHFSQTGTYTSLLAVGILGHAHFFYHFSCQVSERDTDICSLEKLLLSSLLTALLYHMIFCVYFPSSCQ